MLSFDEIDNRSYSLFDTPSVKDVAIALIHWSQYQWANVDEYHRDLVVLDGIRSHFPAITGNLQNLYRGIWLSESEVNFLLSGESVVFKSCNSVLPPVFHKYESWATSFNSALKFAVRSKTGYSAVLKKPSNEFIVAWVAKQLCDMIPQEITDRFPDLQDTEDEVVVERKFNNEIRLEDIAVIYRGTEVIHSA